jgi:hypothetical protein
MKRIIIYLLIILTLLSFSRVVFAVSENNEYQVISVDQTKYPSEAIKEGLVPVIAIDYALPYPGILIDHPLYFLKRFRDSLMTLFITSPVRKADFYILQSDKYLAMVVMFDAKNNWVGMLKAAKESVKNFDHAIAQVKISKSQGGIVLKGEQDRMVNSLSKHIEILSNLQNKAKSTYKQTFDNLVDELVEYQSQVAAL